MRKSSSRHAEKGEAGGFRALMAHTPFLNVLVLYALSNLVMFSWEAVFPLFAFTSKELGGLGLSVSSPAVPADGRHRRSA